ncbi:MAG: hypothetical protein AAF346_00025 [Pseudomonadota bacterium]
MSDEEFDGLVVIRSKRRRELAQAREAYDAAQRAFDHIDAQVKEALDKKK